MEIKVSKAKNIKGKITVPGDKSISHRAIIIGSLATGETEISGFLEAEDCLCTIDCMRALGVEIERDGGSVLVRGRGLHGLSEPERILDVGNSGTTFRLLAGVLAGQEFTSFITGDRSILSRPMGRIIDPLTALGAQIMARGKGTLAPLAIKGGNLGYLEYKLPVASAQLKSALLLAGLYSPHGIALEEKMPTRNHTELMLAAFGAQLETTGTRGIKIKLGDGAELRAQKLHIPGDISSAAFLLAAAIITPESEIEISSVGLNPGRSGFLRVLEKMGVAVEITDRSTTVGEPLGTIRVRSTELSGIKITAEDIPDLVDEIPIITVLAACATGETEISGAAELRLKETDRLLALSTELGKMGAEIHELPDGLRIVGGNPLHGARVKSHGDHRMVMALAVAGLVATGETVIEDAEVVNISFPEFMDILTNLKGS